MLIDLDLASGGRYASGVIGNDQFGANYLFNRERFAEGVGADGGYDEVAARLGVGHVRYPGGTVTERQFSLTDPENDFQAVDLVSGAALGNAKQHVLTPMTDFLAWADGAGVKVTLVLPSAQYEGNPARAAAEVETFVRGVLTGPYARVVETFELGNEWATFFGSAASYGQIANAMALGVVAGAAGTGFDPAIAIQPSARAARLHETQAIADQLSPQALAAIDAVVIHDYRPEPWSQRDISAQKIDHAAVFERAAGRDLQVVSTEWNVGNRSANDGLLQAAGMLDLFWTHVVEGVDRAHVWPVLENNTTRLADDVDATNPDAGAGLMIGGEIFRQMVQSIEGTQVMNLAPSRDVDGDGTADLLVHGYQAADRMVLFVTSLEAQAQEVTLSLGDLADIDQAFQHLWVTEMTVGDGVDPTSPDALPVMRQVAGTVAADVTLALDAYQVTRLEFAADCGVALCETAALDDLRGTDASEVFVLADDGQRDLVRGFDVEMDRIDVSAFGARSLDTLVLTELQRRDGSVSWLQIEDAAGTAEAIVRFNSGETSLDRLRADNFIFAGEDTPAPVPGMNRVEETTALDRIRGTAAEDAFVMLDDDQRDLVRDFEDGADLLDVSRLATGFEDLQIEELVRRDGSTAWIEISDAAGEAELVLRFADGAHEAARLTAEDFIF